jgi:hypothetical protein
MILAQILDEQRSMSPARVILRPGTAAFWHTPEAQAKERSAAQFTGRRVGAMKKQWGRWQVDTEASTLVYDSGREIRIFTVPPGDNLKPSEVLDWIIRAYPPGQPAGDEIEDLAGAVGDLIGLGGRTPSGPGWARFLRYRPEREKADRQVKGLV